MFLWFCCCRLYSDGLELGSDLWLPAVVLWNSAPHVSTMLRSNLDLSDSVLDILHQVLYLKCRCATSAVIIEDFLFMHTVGQHKPLSLAHEEGDPTKWGSVSDFGGAGSGCLFSMHTGDRLKFTSLKNIDLHYWLLCLHNQTKLITEVWSAF